jgi:formylmethanofuran--tetrahydromethanopterin N-formyltransferase
VAIKQQRPTHDRSEGLDALLAINDIPIEDTFAEAFPMIAARLWITAESAKWAGIAAQVTTGYASSVIGCDAEAAACLE